MTELANVNPDITETANNVEVILERLTFHIFEEVLIWSNEQASKSFTRCVKKTVDEFKSGKLVLTKGYPQLKCFQVDNVINGLHCALGQSQEHQDNLYAEIQELKAKLTKYESQDSVVVPVEPTQATIDITKVREAFSTWHESEYGERVTWWEDVPASHIHNDRWAGWNASTFYSESQHKENLVIQSQGLILTCEKLLEALQYGAPDLKIEKTEYSDEQMSTEMTIVHRDMGPSGAGIYAYCTEYPEEGSIKLGDANEHSE